MENIENKVSKKLFRRFKSSFMAKVLLAIVSILLLAFLFDLPEKLKNLIGGKDIETSQTEDSTFSQYLESESEEVSYDTDMESLDPTYKEEFDTMISDADAMFSDDWNL